MTTRDVDQCFAGVNGIAHYQLRQVGEAHWHLRFIKDVSAPVEGEVQLVRNRLEKLLGSGSHVSVEAADLLMPELSGKFRLSYMERSKEAVDE